MNTTKKDADVAQMEAELAKTQTEWLSFDEIVAKSRDIDEAVRLAAEQENRKTVVDKVAQALRVRRLKAQLADEKRKLGDLHADTSRKYDVLQKTIEKEREAKAAREEARGKLGVAQGVLYGAQQRIRRLEKQVADLEKEA
jgi:hypothetical protein